MNKKVAYVIVRVETLHDSKIDDILTDCKINLPHSEIVKTKIVDVFDESDKEEFTKLIDIYEGGK